MHIMAREGKSTGWPYVRFALFLCGLVLLFVGPAMPVRALGAVLFIVMGALPIFEKLMRDRRAAGAGGISMLDPDVRHYIRVKGAADEAIHGDPAKLVALAADVRQPEWVRDLAREELGKLQHAHEPPTPLRGEEAGTVTLLIVDGSRHSYRAQQLLEEHGMVFQEIRIDAARPTELSGYQREFQISRLPAVITSGSTFQGLENIREVSRSAKIEPHVPPCCSALRRARRGDECVRVRAARHLLVALTHCQPCPTVLQSH